MCHISNSMILHTQHESTFESSQPFGRILIHLEELFTLRSTKNITNEKSAHFDRVYVKLFDSSNRANFLLLKNIEVEFSFY